jgi:capsular exopolysaccharide synthesis family protein
MNAELQPTIAQSASDDEGGLQLGQIAAALRRRILLIAGITTIVTSAAVLKALTDTPIYQGSFELLAQSVTPETRLISITNPDALSGQEDLLAASVDEAKLRILTSPRILEPILAALQEDYPDLTYEQLLNGLSLRLTAADILTVQYQHPDPLVVEDVLNEVAEAYIEFSLEDRQSDILRGIAFVDEQLPQLRERVDSLQAELESLRQDNNLIDPQLQGEQVSTQVASFAAERVNIQIQLDEARRLYIELQREFNQRGVSATASVLTEDPRYQQLLDQMLEIDRQIAEASALLREESPEIQVLLSQRRNLVPLLQLEGDRVQRQLESYIRELNVRYDALSAAIESLNEQINDLSSVTRQYTDIQRELAIATQNLNDFLTKREALRIDAAQRQAPWELLTQPGEPQASVASARRNLVLGMALGMILGTGAALFLDKFRSVVHSSKEIKDITNLPLLGTIPLNTYLQDHSLVTSNPNVLEVESWLKQAMPKADDLVEPSSGIQDSPAFNEAFRSLYANIRLVNPDEPIRALTISSAVPNEGKTTVAVNLARAAAAMGKKVLLVDTDLRRPRVHQALGLENAHGVVDWVGLGTPLGKLTQGTLGHPNLFFLAAGSPPPDPTAILASESMQQLTEEIKSKFDLLIYDTPPLLGFADSYLVVPQTQGLLLVAGVEKVKRSELIQAIDNLSISKLPVLGVVANGTTEQESLPYEYYQYYASDSRPSITTRSTTSEGKISALTNKLTHWLGKVLPF